MENRAHIVVRDLNVSIRNVPVLKNIRLAVPDRKITAIIGPSGCGKTTLLRSFNRLIDSTEGVRVSGEVLVDDENILDARAEVTHIRKKMGLLLQKPYPLPMSIYENVAYGPRIHGLRDRRRLDAIVERFLKKASLWDEVKDRLNQPASALSLGQQQRLCLARTLALQPEVILLDEPTSGLDPISTGKVEQTLQELKASYTIVIVPHSVQQAARVADWATFFLQGELVESGPRDQIFTNPQDRRTDEYITGRFG